MTTKPKPHTDLDKLLQAATTVMAEVVIPAKPKKGTR